MGNLEGTWEKRLGRLTEFWGKYFASNLQKPVFPGSSVVKNPLANAGDMGSIPGSGRSPGGGTGNASIVWKMPWAEEPAGL